MIIPTTRHNLARTAARTLGSIALAALAAIALAAPARRLMGSLGPGRLPVEAASTRAEGPESAPGPRGLLAAYDSDAEPNSRRRRPGGRLAKGSAAVATQALARALTTCGVCCERILELLIIADAGPPRLLSATVAVTGREPTRGRANEKKLAQEKRQKVPYINAVLQRSCKNCSEAVKTQFVVRARACHGTRELWVLIPCYPRRCR